MADGSCGEKPFPKGIRRVAKFQPISLVGWFSTSKGMLLHRGMFQHTKHHLWSDVVSKPAGIHLLITSPMLTDQGLGSASPPPCTGLGRPRCTGSPEPGLLQRPSLPRMQHRKVCNVHGIGFFSSPTQAEGIKGSRVTRKSHKSQARNKASSALVFLSPAPTCHPPLLTHHKAKTNGHHLHSPLTTVPSKASPFHHLLRDHISSTHQGPCAKSIFRVTDPACNLPNPKAAILEAVHVIHVLVHSKPVYHCIQVANNGLHWAKEARPNMASRAANLHLQRSCKGTLWFTTNGKGGEVMCVCVRGISLVLDISTLPQQELHHLGSCACEFSSGAHTQFCPRLLSDYVLPVPRGLEVSEPKD